MLRKATHCAESILANIPCLISFSGVTKRLGMLSHVKKRRQVIGLIQRVG